MVSAWWLLAAFWAGTCVGIVLAALMVRTSDLRDADTRERGERRSSRRKCSAHPEATR